MHQPKSKVPKLHTFRATLNRNRKKHTVQKIKINLFLLFKRDPMIIKSG